MIISYIFIELKATKRAFICGMCAACSAPCASHKVSGAKLGVAVGICTIDGAGVCGF